MLSGEEGREIGLMPVNRIGSCLFPKNIISQSDPEFKPTIAITITIENRSGKIGDRF
jgi:hypothetical protein